MDKYVKLKVNNNFDHWKFTQDGRFEKCHRKYKKMRRRNQRAIEKRKLNEQIRRT